MTDTLTTEGGIEYLRTSETRFASVDDFPYEPHYVEIDGMRMAYYRVLIPDLIGFGRSDKPTERSSYTYAGHVEWMRQFVREFNDARGLADQPLHFFGQDWGGLIGLRLAAENPDFFERLVLANTGLPVGQSLGPGFDFWLELSQTLDFIDCGRLVDNTSAFDLDASVKAAYNAPFPDETSMAGARQFPPLVPITLDNPAVVANLAAWQVLEQWTKPVLTLWAPGDPVLGSLQASFVDRIPGASGQPHQQFEPGGHFVQEEHGPALAQAMVAWLSDA